MPGSRHVRAVQPVASPPPDGRNVIAVVGIDRYRHWPPLSNAVGDAAGVLRTFRELGYVELTRHLFDEAATAEAIRTLVSDELHRLARDDSLVLFLAGHGHTEVRTLPGEVDVKSGYLVPVDAAPIGERRFSTLLRLDSLLEDLARLPARHILVIVDACFSGVALGGLVKWRGARAAPVEPRALRALHGRRSRRVITSALDDQPALDSGPIPGHSLFTGILVEVLLGGGAQLGRPFITGSELGVLVQQRVADWPGSRQTPDFGALALDDRGEMFIPRPAATALVVGEGSDPSSSEGSALGQAAGRTRSRLLRRTAMSAAAVSLASVGAYALVARAPGEIAATPPLGAAVTVDASASDAGADAEPTSSELSEDLATPDAAPAVVATPSRSTRMTSIRESPERAPPAPVKRRATSPEAEEAEEAAAKLEAERLLAEARAHESRGDWEYAYEKYQLVAKTRHERVAGYLGMAETSWQLKHVDRVIEYATKALQLGAGDRTRLLLGHAYFRKGNYKQALRYYEEVLAKDPANEEAAKSAAEARRWLDR